MAYCSNCGKEITEPVKFCSNCGAKIVTAFQDSEVTEKENPENVESKTETSSTEKIPSEESTPSKESSTSEEELTITVSANEAKNGSDKMPTYVGIASLVTLILGLIILFNYPGLVSDLLFFASLCMAIFALVKKCRWKAFPIVTVVVNVLIILLVVYLFGKGELTTAKKKMKNGSIKSAVTTTQNSHVNPELKSFLDSYESFVDDYVKLMEKYKKDPTNLSLLSDYYSFIGKLADFETKLGKIDASKLSGDDYAYYIDVTSRCTQKMLTVTK